MRTNVVNEFVRTVNELLLENFVHTVSVLELEDGEEIINEEIFMEDGKYYMNYLQSTNPSHEMYDQKELTEKEFLVAISKMAMMYSK